LATPRLYGWTSAAELHTLDLPAAPFAAGLAQNPKVTAVADGTYTDLSIAGHTVQAVALDDIRKTVRPDLLAGRPLHNDHEIILGNRTLHDAGAHVGGFVTVSAGPRVERMRVVGRAVFAEGGDAAGHVDQGAQITYRALHSFAPGLPATIIRFTLARSAQQPRVLARIRNAAAPLQILLPVPPTTITSFGRTGNLPSIVAAIMGLVAAATMAHAMVTSVRRRRREFAVLETLGFVRRQRSAIVAATATTYACAAVLIGIPFGLVAGRWAWSEVASVLGVLDRPTVDVLTVVLVAAGLVMLANLIALVPAAMARRTNAAVTLRAE
jgi:predicted lysophospholipase L1 biosynthesis ABC-type transport system permease subunit